MQSLNQYKKRYLTILLTGFIILFLLLLAVSFGTFSDKVHWAWGWLLLLYLPPLIVLFQIKNTRLKRTINGLEILFVLFVLATVLVIILAINYVGTIPFSQPFKLSTLFLMPLSLLLVFLVWKNILQPIKIAGEKELIIVEPKVFISYNHNDSAVALKIQDALKKGDIEVIIDRENMMAGTKIKEFIEDSIRDSTVTVSLVSNKSLKSAWVAMETIDSIFLERYKKNKKFIACYLDEEFFQPDYTLKTVGSIDNQIKANQKLIVEHQKKMLDTRNLNNENTRLIALRNNLDGIIGNLKDSLCLDVRGDKFEQSMNKLIDTIEADE